MEVNYDEDQLQKIDDKIKEVEQGLLIMKEDEMKFNGHDLKIKVINSKRDFLDLVKGTLDTKQKLLFQS